MVYLLGGGRLLENDGYYERAKTAWNYTGWPTLFTILAGLLAPTQHLRSSIKWLFSCFGLCPLNLEILCSLFPLSPNTTIDGLIGTIHCSLAIVTKSAPLILYLWNNGDRCLDGYRNFACNQPRWKWFRECNLWPGQPLENCFWRWDPCLLMVLFHEAYPYHFWLSGPPSSLDLSPIIYSRSHSATGFCCPD